MEYTDNFTQDFNISRPTSLACNHKTTAPLDIKVARSVSDVGHFRADVANFIDNGSIKSGTFNVKSGESIYIGHFHIDCQQQPIIWRYYPEDKEGYASYIKSVVLKYNFLDKRDIKFRLFKTNTMGYDYDLPE